jgi:predicted metal-dependent HD superfamily phosphohydrolase
VIDRLVHPEFGKGDRNMDFTKSWSRAWLGLDSTNNEQNLFRLICSHYAESTRQYHTLQHLGECLDLFESVMDLATHPAEIEMALWFHDAVYSTVSQDNEVRSSQWARLELCKAGVLPEKIDRIQSLIMATCHTSLPKMIDECLLIDIDLAILGSSAERFAEYEQQIRTEYKFVPEPIFNQKRKEILQGFLDRSTIYSTEHFQDKLELLARKNIRRSIKFYQISQESL